MTKRTPPPSNRQPVTPAVSHQSHAAAIRETIESIASAFILAFLFRTFEAEAFVIPTGSMAPTLKGRHKDLECPECHYNFQVSASEEVDRDGKAKEEEFVRDGKVIKKAPLIDRCTCPMCRFVWDGKAGPAAQPSYNGDRILVNKFAYQFDDPERWDVIVFKFPDKSQENYIKRLIGLPNETIRVYRGDIWFQGLDDDGNPRQFEIANKPPEKLRVMLQPVFDNDFMPTIEKIGWPFRWRPELSADGSAAGQWTSSDHAAYQTDGSAAGETWLRYEHRVPSADQWNGRERGLANEADSVKPQLITDFTPYNTGSSGEDQNKINRDLFGLHWVGDLALQCQADVENDRGQIILELVKGGRKFQCRIDVSTGIADFLIDGLDKSQFNPKTQTVAKGPGKYELMFANCDRRLFLWVNGVAVQYVDYPDLQNNIPTKADLQPVGVASSGVKMKLEHLKIFRDIYYVANIHRQSGIMMIDYLNVPQDILYGDLERFFSDPNRWNYVDAKKQSWNYFDDKNMSNADFMLKKDEFFAMGDNSAKSLDSRAWGNVPRDLLIGKAFFVYWPHSWNRIPGTNIPFPFFPNFARMGFVR